MFDWIDDFLNSLIDVGPTVDFLGYCLSLVPIDWMTFAYVSIALVIVIGVVWILCQIF